MELYPYQQAGADFLTGKTRALLADRMGLGKTIQAIVAAKQIDSPETLVICPASVIPNWEHEWRLWGGPENVRFVSFSKLIHENWREYSPFLTIVDEAHYCKNPTAKRTRAALGIAGKSPFAWLLTGTPMPNNPTELYPFFKYLWPEELADLGVRTADQWMDRFCLTRYTEYGPKPYAVKNGTLLRAKLQPNMLRRALGDVGFELPPLRVDLHRLPKSDLDLEEYGAVEEAEYMSTIRRLLGTAKAPAVANQVADELENGDYEQVVVLYHHHDVGNQIRSRLNVMQVTTTGFNGSTPVAYRAAAIEEFQAGAAQVFLAQQTAAGIGITLTAAHEIILVEPAWSPDDNFQAITRIHRIGQDQPCRARLFAVTGTLDEAIMATIRTKLQMQADVGLKGEQNESH